MKILSILFFVIPFVAQAKYNRKLFPHWVDKDKDCQNERQEVLISRSKTPVVLKRNKKGRKCTVLSGKWDDFYYPEVLLFAKKIDIDHVVPLKHAYESGAKSWKKKKRREFANDHENLVITNLKYNRSKGAKTPLEWLPVSREYACKYLKKWIYIKKKYSLAVNSAVVKYKEQVCE